jgi:hypothetical protein
MIKAKVISIEDGKAHLELEDGQIVVVPQSAIEGTVVAGGEAAVVIATLGGEDAGRQALARHLLNEILAG